MKLAWKKSVRAAGTTAVLAAALLTGACQSFGPRRDCNECDCGTNAKVCKDPTDGGGRDELALPLFEGDVDVPRRGHAPPSPDRRDRNLTSIQEPLAPSTHRQARPFDGLRQIRRDTNG